MCQTKQCGPWSNYSFESSFIIVEICIVCDLLPIFDTLTYNYLKILGSLFLDGLKCPNT